MFYFRIKYNKNLSIYSHFILTSVCIIKYHIKIKKSTFKKMSAEIYNHVEK